MKRLALVVLVVVLMGLTGKVWADVVMVIHGHSTFSDGKQTLRETFASLRSRGAEVAIVTDHAESFIVNDRVDKEKLARWKQEYRELSSPWDLTFSVMPAEKCVVPALEVGLVAKDKTKPADRCRHFLFIGGSVNDDTYDQVVQWCLRYSDASEAAECLRNLSALARERGAVIIAAHPTNPIYLVEPELLQMVNGVEVMNRSINPSDFSSDTPKAVLEKLLAVPNGLVTAGADWHGAQVGDLKFGLVDSLQRFTIALTDEATPKGILGAFQQGKTYSAYSGARIAEGREMIGKEIGPSKFRMSFTGLSGACQKAWVATRSADGICRGIKECSLGNRTHRIKPVVGWDATLDVGDLRSFLGPAMANGGWIYVAVPADQGNPEVITSAIRIPPYPYQQVAENPGTGGEKLATDDAVAYNNRGVVYYGKGDYDRAMSDFNKAIELKPDLAAAYNNRGVVYRDKGDYDRAMRDYTKAIELKPDDAEAYNNRGVVYFRKGDYDRAMSEYDKAIELKPDLAAAYYNRGVTWYLRKDYNRARADAQKSRDLGYTGDSSKLSDKLREATGRGL